MRISILAAIGKNNELGGNNQLLWKLSDDLKMFKQLTMGHCIVMGRKTFESIGKPLPGRKNIVVTSGMLDVEDVYTTTDLNHGIEMARGLGEDEVFIIGGAQLFNYAMDLADRMYISHVDGVFEDADVFLPAIDYSEWEIKETRKFFNNDKNEFDFEFRLYERK